LLKTGENVKLYAISIDPPDVSKKFAEKIAADGKGPLAFPLLSDPGHKIIDTYGLVDLSYMGQDVYGIPHPAVYVIDRSGRVSWVKIESNYRERPVNAEIRTALDVLR
jgi:peroxiredoxin